MFRFFGRWGVVRAVTGDVYAGRVRGVRSLGVSWFKVDVPVAFEGPRPVGFATRYVRADLVEGFDVTGRESVLRRVCDARRLDSERDDAPTLIPFGRLDG